MAHASSRSAEAYVSSYCINDNGQQEMSYSDRTVISTIQMTTVYFSKARNSLATDFMAEANRRKNVEREETPRRDGHEI